MFKQSTQTDSNMIYTNRTLQNINVTVSTAKESIKDTPMSILDNLASITRAIKANSYIVGSFTYGKGVSFSAAPAVHADAVSARAECKRLAMLFPGTMFLYVNLSGAELVPSPTIISI